MVEGGGLISHKQGIQTDINLQQQLPPPSLVVHESFRINKTVDAKETAGNNEEVEVELEEDEFEEKDTVGNGEEEEEEEEEEDKYKEGEGTVHEDDLETVERVWSMTEQISDSVQSLLDQTLGPPPYHSNRLTRR